MTTLIRYDTACRAIAEAKAVDEVKEIRDKAEALRMYARQARNREAEIDMAEIRFRAERRIGEIKFALRAAGELHEGGRPAKTSSQRAAVSKIKLADLGITDKLSVRADQLASVEPDSFECLVGRWRALQEKVTDRVSLNLFTEERDAKRKADHDARTYQGGTIDDLHRLIASGWRAKAIQADPPWHFIARSEKGEGRSAAGHYTTDRRWRDILSLPVAQLADKDCILFMWMVDWCPKLALEVIEAWGFVHKTTAFTWAKQSENGEGWHFGMGYWTRANPEACWLATRGHPKRIHADVAQLIVSPVMEHSRKPDEIYRRIERLVDGPYLELYARRERQGWLTWGNELEFRVPTVASGMTNTDRSSNHEFPDLPAFLKRGPDGLAPWQHDLAASYPPTATRPTTTNSR
jgi:N6-adenosine-specific RNA methylase IME4